MTNLPPVNLGNEAHAFLKIRPDPNYLVRDVADAEHASDLKHEYVATIRALGGFVSVPTTPEGAMNCDLLTQGKFELLALVPMEPATSRAQFTMVGGSAPSSCQHGYWCTTLFAPGHKFWVRSFNTWTAWHNSIEERQKYIPAWARSARGEPFLQPQYMEYTQRL